MGLSPAPKRRLVDADTTTHAEPPPTPLSPMAPMCRASWGSFTNLLQHCANAKAAGHSGSDHNVRTRNQIRFGALRPERVKLRVPPPALALH
jgi:hypothetical protein